MMVTIILGVILGIGVILSRTKYEESGVLLIIISAACIGTSIAFSSTSHLDYERFTYKRSAFQRTLTHSRAKGLPHETAAIVKDIAKWNEALAMKKYENKGWFTGQYVDDRFDKLEYIK